MSKVYHKSEEDVTDEERADLIERFRENVIGFERAAVKHFGAAGGIFARQLLFWDGKGASDDFWVYKSHPEWYKDTGLKRRAQESARKRLIEAGVMREEKRIGPDRRWRLFFRLYPLKLMEVLGDDLPNSEEIPANSTVSDVTGTVSDVTGTVSDVTGTVSETPGYTEEHPEDHSEEVFPPKPPQGGDEGKNETAKRGADAATSLSGHPTQQKGRGKAGADKERSPRRRSRSGTPAVGIEALREHRHPKLGYPDLEDAAKIAERFDFSSDAEPPWQIMKELNNDRKYFDKARLIVGRAMRGEPIYPQYARNHPDHPDNLKAAALSASEAALSASDGAYLPAPYQADRQPLESNLEAEDFPEPDMPLVKSF